MELTFDDKLDMVFGTIPDTPIIEAAVDDDDDQDLGLDKRLGVTTSWKHYRSDLRTIQQTRNRAKELGLDREFKQLANGAIERDIDSISAEAPLNFSDARAIVWAIYHSGFKDKLEDAQREESGRAASKDEVPADVHNAIQMLYKEAKAHHGTRKPTVMQLVNTRNVNVGPLPMKVSYRMLDGHVGRLKLSNSEPLHEQFKKLVVVLHTLGYRDLLAKLKKTFEARTRILDFYWWNRTESQRKYTAAFYSVRNIADELSQIEVNKKSRA